MDSSDEGGVSSGEGVDSWWICASINALNSCSPDVAFPLPGLLGTEGEVRDAMRHVNFFGDEREAFHTAAFRVR